MTGIRITLAVSGLMFIGAAARAAQSPLDGDLENQRAQAGMRFERMALRAGAPEAPLAQAGTAAPSPSLRLGSPRAPSAGTSRGSPMLHEKLESFFSQRWKEAKAGVLMDRVSARISQAGCRGFFSCMAGAAASPLILPFEAPAYFAMHVYAAGENDEMGNAFPLLAPFVAAIGLAIGAVGAPISAVVGVGKALWLSI